MPNIVEHIDVRDGMIYKDRPAYFFGYGLESKPEVMEVLTGGNILTTELGVTAIGKQLHVQEIDQVPDAPAEVFGGKSPQQILAAGWKKHTDVPFSSYVLRPSENRSDAVTGTLYELNLGAAQCLNEWDLVTPPKKEADGSFTYAGWRYWDHLVELVDGRKVSTVTTYPEQATDRVVNGLEYDPFLNDPMVTLAVIKDFVKQLQDGAA